MQIQNRQKTQFAPDENPYPCSESPGSHKESKKGAKGLQSSSFETTQDEIILIYLLIFITELTKTQYNIQIIPLKNLIVCIQLETAK